MERKNKTVGLSQINESGSHLLSAHRVSVSFGSTTIFENINFSLHYKDKIALLGNNGSGKTTLLRAIIDDPMLEGLSGKFIFNKQAKIGFIPQDQRYTSLSPDETLLDSLKKAAGTFNLEKRMFDISNEERFIKGDDQLLGEFGIIMDKIGILDGWDIENRGSRFLKGFGVKADMNQLTSKLSEADQRKLFLAGALVKNPNILLLDEPLNHLDEDAQIWLADYLDHFLGAALVVAHDRSWLELFANGVIDLDTDLKVGTQYRGSIPAYLAYKKQAIEYMVKKKQGLEEQIEDNLEIWSRLKSNLKKAGTASSHHAIAKRKQKELDELGVGTRIRNIGIEFKPARTSGKEVLKAEGLKAGYGGNSEQNHTTVIDLSNIKLNIKRGDKLAIIGKLHSGRSTLLKILSGSLNPIEGTILWASNTDIGYMDQNCSELQSNLTIFEQLSIAKQDTSKQTIRNILANFLFSQDDIYKKISYLSGGERKRVSLARLILTGPNVLLLDEPTNDLDVLTRERLGDALKEYEGTVLIVPTRLDLSTRQFLEKIGINQGILVPSGYKQDLS